MMLRWASNACFVVGFVLLAAAVGMYFAPADGPGVTIEEPERERLTLAAGKRASIEFRIENPTGHTARVVGLAEC